MNRPQKFVLLAWVFVTVLLGTFAAMEPPPRYRGQDAGRREFILWAALSAAAGGLLVVLAGKPLPGPGRAPDPR